MTIALGNKTSASVSEDDLVYIVALVGHSGVSGGSPISLLTTPSFPLDRALLRTTIWDKTQRDNDTDDSLVDASRGDEAHQLRPLSTGYAGTSPKYPWEGGPEPVDPHFAAELPFGADWEKHRKGRLVVVKHAIGGSQANDVVGSQDWNINDDSGLSHTEVFITAYWAPALTAAIALAGGDRSKVRILGIGWFQGFSDARTVPEVTAHAGHVFDLLTEMRSRMDAATPADIPILAINGPLTRDPEGQVIGELVALRAGIEGLATGSGEPQELVNCTILDTEGYPDDPLNLPHFTADGNDMLGMDQGRFFRSVTGATLTI